MKPTLLFAALSMVIATPAAFGKSELEILRSRCSEQELQIRQLEDENAKLRSGGHETRPTPAKVETAATAGKPAAQPSAVESERPSYTVKAGDSMEKIARKVGASPQKLAKLNGLKPSSIIHPGQKLKVPGAATRTAESASAPVAAVSPPVRKNTGKTHTVRDGETYFSISKKHGMSSAALAAANPKVKASALRTGQVISLGREIPSTAMISAPASHAKASATVEKAATPAPVAKSQAPRETTPVSAPAPSPPAATPESKPAPAATAQAADTESLSPANNDKKIRPITIDGEMTYGEFASKHGTDAERLNALNGLDLTKATVLAKGSELYVPAQP